MSSLSYNHWVPKMQTYIESACIFGAIPALQAHASFSVEMSIVAM